ncbi:threonine ammonia-lyase [Saccharomonospora viridis]|jgi:threonine dehydratase|uniref:threonine ammonia-lyase n=2 Tax=Saccharomonospora viridis TaxID=1852 RepID=C7MZ34_SACVD|nr:threonine/serine dehydratase [Saccharomonospora viridis]ACU96155.1 threonine dehydratase [Saccharomonospora viridis DSM 43017]KHF45340.1 threonine dehydratase [Saccharomonospora viridis]SFP78945.1 threonine dehydratase [Saccharomonospora viridis]
MELVTLDDVRAAGARIASVVVRTPLLPCPWVKTGRDRSADDRGLWLKPENLQPIGAFKIRGAHNAIARLDEQARARGVVAYSSGNHAQAVAHAAAAAGITAHIVMPASTPRVKVENTRSHGAEVVLVGDDEREAVAYEIVSERGAVLVPPFDHPDVIAGQGTIGLEIVEDLPEVDVVLVPVSGGGLASGVATAVTALRPNAKVIGVEPELASDAKESLRAGKRVDWPVADRFRTIADGLRSQPSELTFAHLRRRLHDIVTVTEDEIRSAVATLARKARLVAEPSGAVATAAYLFHGDELPVGRTVAVVSGGNIDPALLADVLATPAGEED